MKKINVLLLGVTVNLLLLSSVYAMEQDLVVQKEEVRAEKASLKNLLDAMQKIASRLFSNEKVIVDSSEEKTLEQLFEESSALEVYTERVTNLKGSPRKTDRQRKIAKFFRAVRPCSIKWNEAIQQNIYSKIDSYLQALDKKDNASARKASLLEKELLELYKEAIPTIIPGHTIGLKDSEDSSNVNSADLGKQILLLKSLNAAHGENSNNNAPVVTDQQTTEQEQAEKNPLLLTPEEIVKQEMAKEGQQSQQRTEEEALKVVAQFEAEQARLEEEQRKEAELAAQQQDSTTDSSSTAGVIQQDSIIDINAGNQQQDSTTDSSSTAGVIRTQQQQVDPNRNQQVEDLEKDAPKECCIQ